MIQRTVLVTGASGFVGTALVKRLCEASNYSVIAASRRVNQSWPEGVKYVSLKDFEKSDIDVPLTGVDTIVHCAARVHVMSESVSDPISEFRKVNVHPTLSLARCAASAGVRRFVFISTIKVHGESTVVGKAFCSSDIPVPKEPYSISKLEAECGLMHLSRETGMEIVIIRPPLIYGPGVKGNFSRLIKFISKNIPVPLCSTNNKRSMVGVSNLVDFIICCIEHPSAANQVFLVSDGEDLSTTELLRSISKVTGRPVRLVPVPIFLLVLGATILGKRSVARRLLGSLQVDISKARELLGWVPPISVEEELRRCIRDSYI